MSTRYYIDTEFIDTGTVIDLISIGIVGEDGREYYAQSSEFNIDKANYWVRENVIMHLDLCPHVAVPSTSQYSLGTLYGVQGQHKDVMTLHPDCPWRMRYQMMYEVAHFLQPALGQPDDEHEPFELYGWCSAYDFVALCQLFGTMMDLPLGWPHYIRDLQHVLDDLSIADEELPQQESGVHHALEDARHIKRLWEHVNHLVHPHPEIARDQTCQ